MKKSILLTSLSLCFLINNNQAKAFDPNEALKQHSAQQEAQKQAQKASEEKAIYERYRNKEVAHINNDGTVTIGNLQWMRCSLGQQWNRNTCRGNASEHNWDEALLLPELMNAQGGFAGHRDWRLPSIIELASLRVCTSGRASYTIDIQPGGLTTHDRCSGDFSRPTLDTHLFPRAPQSYVWSGTLGRSIGRSVLFSTGFISLPTLDHIRAVESEYEYPRSHIRLVRDVQ